MRNLFLSFFVFFIGFFGMGQNTINSPYSSLGLGELGGMDHAVFSAIGNTTITLHDSTVLNYYNPASYGTLAHGLPIFSFGLSTRLSDFSENDQSHFASATAIQHMAIGFAIAKRFGLAFGLKQYTRRGYEFSSYTAIEDDSLFYKYQGSGGVHEAFLGVSANIIDTKGARLSIGGNLGYLFGTTTNFRKSSLVSSGAGGISSKEMKVSSFHYEIGAQYTQRFNEKHTLGVFAVFDPFQKINGKYEEGLYYSTAVDNENSYDTLSFNDTLSGNLTNIPTYNFGLSYSLNFKARKGQTNEFNSQISFHASYATSEWEKYENRFDPNFTNAFLNSSKMTFGIQYIPETDFIGKKVVTKFYHRIRYRVGVYQGTLPYQINGQQVTDFGTTVGFGIPIMAQNSLSSINVGFTIGKRGVADPQAFKEQYYGINIGIAIAPGTDRWFVKRKLN